MLAETKKAEYEKLTSFLQEIQLGLERKHPQQIIEETEVPEDYPLLGMLIGDLDNEVSEILEDFSLCFASQNFFLELRLEVQKIPNLCYYKQMALIQKLLKGKAISSSSELLRVFLEIIARDMEENDL